MFLDVEAGLVLLSVGIAFVYPKLGSHWFEALERSFSRLAGRRGLAVLVTGLAALAARAAMLPILPIPDPAVHDGFGYLLLADTFAHGRLTNPTNPMWVHFESIHILWQPTYTTKFYPAQGLFMALGQVLMGHPFWGVWLSAGLMCAAITWMLQGWLAPGWALLGGLLAMIRFGTFSYWANSYFGGAVAALGGALVLGALPRLKQEQRVRDALLMGLGFAIIGNSRPYEGLFLGIPVVTALLAWMWRKKQSDRRLALKRAIAPLLLVLVLTGVAMGYYFWRTIGSPWSTPYMVYIHTYDPVPNFPWQSLKSFPVYHHAVLRSFFEGFERSQYEVSQTPIGLAKIWLNGSKQFWSFFLGFVFTLPLLMVFAALPYGFSLRDISPKTRFLLVVCGVTLAGEALPIWFQPHYAAPLTGAILAVVLIAMHRIRHWQWHGKPTGLFITRSIPSICLLLVALRIAANPLRLPLPYWPERNLPGWCSLTPSNHERAAMLAKLEQYPGRQLVIVHYNANHDIHRVLFDEWVYNRADFASAKVIWARDMGPAKNEELIKYFKDRHAWLVEADDNPARLLPYSVLSPQGAHRAAQGAR